MFIDNKYVNRKLKKASCIFRPRAPVVITTKRTITSHLNSLNINKRPRHITLEMHVLA